MCRTSNSGLGRAGIFLTDQVGSILKSSLNDISLMVSVRQLLDHHYIIGQF